MDLDQKQQVEVLCLSLLLRTWFLSRQEVFVGIQFIFCSLLHLAVFSSDLAAIWRAVLAEERSCYDKKMA